MKGEPSSHMRLALEKAAEAAQRGEVPVGAVIVDASSGDVIASAGNAVIDIPDPTGHAEIRALRQACRLRGNERLPDCDIYVTLEPCPMCAQAISFARIRRVYYGAADSKGGGVDNGPRIFGQPTCHHRPEVYGGLSERESAKILQDFFETRR